MLFQDAFQSLANTAGTPADYVKVRDKSAIGLGDEGSRTLEAHAH